MTPARVTAQCVDTQSNADFLTATALQLLLLGAVFIVFGVIALIVFGSLLAVSGLFFIGVAAFLLGRWARSDSRSG